MASITIKNIPDNLYQKLKKIAQLRHRSVNSEILRSIEKAVGASEFDRDPEQLRASIRAFHKKVKGQLTPEEIEAAINEGRP